MSSGLCGWMQPMGSMRPNSRNRLNAAEVRQMVKAVIVLSEQGKSIPLPHLAECDPALSDETVPLPVTPRRKWLLFRGAANYPDLGSAMHQLKQMLFLSGGSQARPDWPSAAGVRVLPSFRAEKDKSRKTLRYRMRAKLNRT